MDERLSDKTSSDGRARLVDAGMQRKVDVLGRVVIPAEIRRALGLKTGSLLSIAVDGDRIVLSSGGETCVFCGGVEELVEHRHRLVCVRCRQDLCPDSG